MDEKTGWRKVEKIDESMVGWEVKAESPYSIVEIIVNVEGNDFWVRNKDGDHRTLQMSLYDWLVRPPEPPKKKPSEIFMEKYQKYYGHPSPALLTEIQMLLEILDEQFEREEKK